MWNKRCQNRMRFNLCLLVLAIVLGINCAPSKTMLIDEFIGDSYIIDKEKIDQDLRYVFKDTSISSDGAYIFKGLSNSPFGGAHNDETAMYLHADSLAQTMVLFYFWDMGADTLGYVGRVVIKTMHNNPEVVIPVENIRKVFGTSGFKILLLKNNKPVLKYGIYTY